MTKIHCLSRLFASFALMTVMVAGCATSNSPRSTVPPRTAAHMAAEPVTNPVHVVRIAIDDTFRRYEMYVSAGYGPTAARTLDSFFEIVHLACSQGPAECHEACGRRMEMHHRMDLWNSTISHQLHQVNPETGEWESLVLQWEPVIDRDCGDRGDQVEPQEDQCHAGSEAMPVRSPFAYYGDEPSAGWRCMSETDARLNTATNTALRGGQAGQASVLTLMSILRSTCSEQCSELCERRIPAARRMVRVWNSTLRHAPSDGTAQRVRWDRRLDRVCE